MMPATLKKLSARRKKPARGLCGPVSITITSARSLSESRMVHPSSPFSGPPWGLNPEAIARASRSVDLPDPFSPTMKVTSAAGRSAARSWIAGRNG